MFSCNFDVRVDFPFDDTEYMVFWANHDWSNDLFQMRLALFSVLLAQAARADSKSAIICLANVTCSCVSGAWSYLKGMGRSDKSGPAGTRAQVPRA